MSMLTRIISQNNYLLSTALNTSLCFTLRCQKHWTGYPLREVRRLQMTHLGFAFISPLWGDMRDSNPLELDSQSSPSATWVIPP